MMLLIELARHRQTFHSARCEFTLDRSSGCWRLRRKKVNLLKNGSQKTYPGYPHGMLTTHADVLNPDLLAFIKS